MFAKQLKRKQIKLIFFSTSVGFFFFFGGGGGRTFSTSLILGQVRKGGYFISTEIYSKMIYCRVQASNWWCDFYH